jgi:hypothetical protein
MKTARTSPKGGKRGCLCADGKTYSKECCEGELINQGVGKVTGNGNETTVTTYQDGSRKIITNV